MLLYNFFIITNKLNSINIAKRRVEVGGIYHVLLARIFIFASKRLNSNMIRKKTDLTLQSSKRLNSNKITKKMDLTLQSE